MEKDFIESNGEKIYFYVQRKNVKNINLKVNIDKKVTLSIPMKMSLDKAKDFVKKKANWIKKQQDFYDAFSEQKENITFEDGETVYLLGKQYKMKIISDNHNNVVISNKYIEIHIKEKYIDNKSYIKKVYEKWLKQYAMNVLKIEIRQMKTRWGSCIPACNKVIFNLNLIKTPMCCIEYVMLHELSHFKYQNHSKNFYNFITIFCNILKYNY